MVLIWFFPTVRARFPHSFANCKMKNKQLVYKIQSHIVMRSSSTWISRTEKCVTTALSLRISYSVMEGFYIIGTIHKCWMILHVADEVTAPGFHLSKFLPLSKGSQSPFKSHTGTFHSNWSCMFPCECNYNDRTLSVRVSKRETNSYNTKVWLIYVVLFASWSPKIGDRDRRRMVLHNTNFSLFAH